MNNVLTEGLSLMFIGMSTVLIFLCIMIISMNIMSKAVAKINSIFPEPIPVVPGGKKSTASGDNSEIAAAIVAAMFGKK